AASRGLLTLLAFYVVFHALPDARRAARFANGLLIAIAIVALLSIVQVGFCPTGGSLESSHAAIRLLMRKCGPARGFFSIYMTLGGVLTLVLVSALPRVALGGRSAAWAVPAWLVGLVSLGLTSVRGAWLGFAVGVAGCALGLRRRWLVLAALGLVLGGGLVVDPELLRRVKGVGDLADDTARDRLAFLVAGLFEYNFGDTEVLLVALAVMALPFVVERDLAIGATSSRQLRE